MKKPIKTLKKKCKNCGNEFGYKRKTKTFCSQKCSDAYRYSPKKPKGTTNNCPICDKSFYRPASYKAIKRYCGKRCANKALMTNRSLSCVICRKEFYCSKSQEKLRNRKTCSVTCRSKLQTIEAKKRAESNPPSIGAMNRRVRYCKAMQEWRISVFERDNYTCVHCGARNGNGRAVYLEADHIKPFAYYPDLRFDLNNGRTLCRPCHKNTPTYGRKVLNNAS